MKLRKILVPLDGSQLAERALAKAVNLAQSAGDPTLVLMRAAEATSWPGTDVTGEQVRVVREAEDYLAGVKTYLGSRGIDDVDTTVWYGSPASAIIEATRAVKADLIVMTTHGRSGLGRLIMGSVAEAVLRGTTTPILLVRDDGAPVQAPEGAARERAATEARR